MFAVDVESDLSKSRVEDHGQMIPTTCLRRKRNAESNSRGPLVSDDGLQLSADIRQTIGDIPVVALTDQILDGVRLNIVESHPGFERDITQNQGIRMRHNNLLEVVVRRAQLDCAIAGTRPAQRTTRRVDHGIVRAF